MKYASAALIIGLAAFSSAAHAEESFGPASDMQPLTSDELASYRGGYVLPNGLEISVGVSAQTSVNGDMIAATSPSLGATGSLVPIASAATVQLSGQQQVQTYVQAVASGANTTIQNALNKAVIQELTQVDIGVNNFTKLQSSVTTNSALGALSGIMHQAAVSGLH